MILITVLLWFIASLVISVGFVIIIKETVSFLGAERSEVPQGCRRSANCCAEAGAEALSDSLNSSVVAPNEAVRALVGCWRDFAAGEEVEANKLSLKELPMHKTQREAIAASYRNCAEQLEAALQLGAGQRSDQRAIRRNATS
jgi:hypothetical protein